MTAFAGLIKPSHDQRLNDHVVNGCAINYLVYQHFTWQSFDVTIRMQTRDVSWILAAVIEDHRVFHKAISATKNIAWVVNYNQQLTECIELVKEGGRLEVDDWKQEDYEEHRCCILAL